MPRCKDLQTAAGADLNVLKERWWRRLKDARLGLDFAQNYVQEIRRALPRDGFLLAELREAMAARDVARLEYFRALELYLDLVLHGTIPDEAVRAKSGLKSLSVSAAVSV